MNQPLPLPTTSRVARSMAGMLFFRIGGQAITFLILAILARYLGPEKFGIYSTLTIFISFCAILLPPSLNDVMVRDATARSGKVKWTSGEGALALRFGYGLRSVFALIGMIAAIAIGPSISWEGLNLGLIALCSVTLFTSMVSPSLRFAYEVPYQLDYRMDRSASINFSGRVLVLAGFIGAAFLNATLEGIVFTQVAAEIIALAIFIAFLRKDNYPVLPKIEQTALFNAIKITSPLILAEALTLTFTRLDVLLLNHIVNAREAGIFASPMRIIDGLQIIPTILLGALIPLLNRAYKADPGKFEDILKLSARALWACGIICAIAISVYSDAITKLFFGEQFNESAIILKIGVFLAPLVFSVALLSAILIVRGKQKLIAVIYSILAIISVTSNLILVPYAGARGAILAKLLTYLALFPIIIFWVRIRREGWILFKVGAIPFLLAIVVAFGLRNFDVSIYWGLPTITALSAIIIWLSGWFGRNQYDELKSYFSRSETTES